MLIALLAAGCMLVQDVLATIMVQAEAADRGWLAGAMDTLAWYFGIETTSISVAAINGHRTGERIFVLAFVGAANLLGTKLGQVTGTRLLGRMRRGPTLEARVGALDARVSALEASR